MEIWTGKSLPVRPDPLFWLFVTADPGHLRRPETPVVGVKRLIPGASLRNLAQAALRARQIPTYKWGRNPEFPLDFVLDTVRAAAISGVRYAVLATELDGWEDTSKYQVAKIGRAHV